MTELHSFIRDHSDRWQSAINKAIATRPWIRSLGDGAYRIVRRPTDKNRRFRLHIVQFAVTNSGTWAECDCPGYQFGGACVHLATAYRHVIKRALLKQRKKAA